MIQWNRSTSAAPAAIIPPHHERTEDAPEEDAVLVPRRDGEPGEDQHEDEDVVDRERLLDEVAGEELEPGLRPLHPPHAEAEEERERDPDRAPGRRLLHLHLVRVPVEHAEVQREHREDEQVEDDPRQGRFHDTSCGAGARGTWCRDDLRTMRKSPRLAAEKRMSRERARRYPRRASSRRPGASRPVRAKYSRYPPPYGIGPSGPSSRTRFESAPRKRRSCETNSIVPSYPASARTSISFVATSRWFVGSSSTRKFVGS